MDNCGCAIGDNKHSEEVEWGLLNKTCASTEQDFPRTMLESIDDRSACILFLLLNQSKERSLEDTQANIKTYDDQQSADEKWDTPSRIPCRASEVRASGSLDNVDNDSRNDQSNRHSHLRPACPKAAISPMAV